MFNTMLAFVSVLVSDRLMRNVRTVKICSSSDIYLNQAKIAAKYD